METVLRSAQMDSIMDELYQEAFNLDSTLVCYPVRHHSPACSKYLKKTIADYQPDVILIEGPVDANELIPILLHKDTKPPFAFYYSYKDSAALLSEEKKDYTCYYPFLSCSPELVALKEGNERKIPALFMDLPYREILIGSSKGAKILQKEGKKTTNDDYLLSENHYLKKICQKKGLRSFHEFWEKYFEMNSSKGEKEEFVKNLLYYCYLSRLHTDMGEMLTDGCWIRERYMAEQIADYQEQGKKVLAVMGGFHVAGILSFLGKFHGAICKQEEQKKITIEEIKKSLPVFHKRVSLKDSAVYVMPYSEEQADQLNGYASGMPYPAFYEEVWKRMEHEEEAPFYETALYFLIRCGREVRRKEGGLSTYDEICGTQMLTNLAALRGKKEAGIFELQDSVLTCFVKGEVSPSNTLCLMMLRKLMSGKKTGVLWSEAPIPPLIQDFRKKCKAYRLKIQSTLKSEVVLQIFSSEHHREISCFLHQTDFLETGFAIMKKGPRLAKQKDKNLIRETWDYRWEIGVEAELIEKSVYGGTVEEAAKTWLVKQMEDEEQKCGKTAKYAVSAMEMGLPDSFQRILEILPEKIAKESSFEELVECLSCLTMVRERKDLYQVETGESMDQLISRTYQKLVLLLPECANCKVEEQEERLKAMKLLYQLTQQVEQKLDRILLEESLCQLVQEKELNPSIHGAAFGILYAISENYTKRVFQALKGYLRGTHEKMLTTASFFRGLFFTAKDMVFLNRIFMETMDEMLHRISEQEFMEMIPELKLAFCYFTPLEIDRLAQKTAEFYGKGSWDFLKNKGVNPLLFALGERLEQD